MHHLEPIESAYFNWLCAKVISPSARTPTQTYWKLMRELQNTEFVWVVEMDENRAEDGKDLRHEFIVEAHISDPDPVWLEIGCSILEMMIALSRRASFIDGRSPQRWFKIMLENLGLSEFNDAARPFESAVNDILSRLVWRNYEYDGKGGMFPIDDPQHDQRKVELWYQFCEYIV